MRRTLCALFVLVGCQEPPPIVATEPAPVPAPVPEVEDTEGPPVETHEDYVMYGFSFVDEIAAGMPQPGRTVPLEDDLAFLVDEGIALLVSLTTVPTDPLAVEAAGMDFLHLPIVDMQPPTLDQQITFVEEVHQRALAGERVAVHCTAGVGRTGTMLATWFVTRGYAADDAIAEIRALRPGSIETDAQEDSVREFAVIWSQGL
jgi:atypical dual specificity phosphatase